MHQVTRDTLRFLLHHRQWMTGLEIIDILSLLVPPEHAAQFYYKGGRSPGRCSSDRTDTPEDVAVRLGARGLVADLINAVVHDGVVEKIGGRSTEASRFRWIGWRCRSCGTIVRTSEPHNEWLCSTCLEGIKEVCGNGTIANDNA